MRKRLRLLFLIPLIFFQPLNLFSQKPPQLFGTIFDQSNHSPIPYANLYLLAAKTGTISLADGTFTLSLPKLPDTLRISAIGYQSTIIIFDKGFRPEIHIALETDEIELDEIVVRPSENPANIVIRQVLAEKRRYNPDNVNTLACNVYSKIMIKSKGNTEGDSTLEKGVPLFFSEKVSQNYLQQSPYFTRGKIIAERQEGLGLLEELNIKGYANNLSNEFNFYNNIINYFDKPFISPLNSNTFMYYKFRMIDTLYTQSGKEFVIEFIPKNQNDPAFKGLMKVVADDWYISEITTKIPVQANLNFINKIDIRQTFAPINDSTIYIRENDLNAELKITKDNALMKVHFTGILNKRTLYSQVKLNFPPIQPGEEENIWEQISPAPTGTSSQPIDMGDLSTISREKQKLLLEQLRPEELTSREELAIRKISSLNQHWAVRTTDVISRMFATGYLSGKYFEPGPYLEFFKYNKVEGYRFNLTGRTSQEFTKNVLLYGHIGYGTLDHEWKYGAGIKYKLPANHRKIVSFEYRNDLSKLGDNRSIFLIKENMMVTGDDNLLLSLFTRKPLKQLSREISYRGEYYSELKRGIETYIGVSHRKIYSGIYFPFVQNGIHYDYFTNSEVSFRLRLTWDEKYTDNYCRRYYMNSDYPKINVVLTGGQYHFGSVTNEYLKARLVLRHNISIGITRLNYILESGMTFGLVPFPLLETHRTNQSVGNALYSFNLMEEMEYASDRFVSLMAQYKLNGLLFNRIPLIDHLKIREVFSAKLLWSHLDNRHQDIADFQKPYLDAPFPYCELSAGVENLFKLVRIDGIWRIARQQTPTTTKFGIRFRLYLGL